MNRRKKGSILLEAVAAIPIIFIAIIIAARMYVFMNKNIKSEYMDYCNRESLNAVCSELKYNVEFDTLKSTLKSRDIFIKYDEHFLDRLEEKSLKDLEDSCTKENRIEIKLIEEQSSSMKIQVSLHWNLFILKEEVQKGRWMDYI